MRHKVSQKQPNSKMCLVCGLENGIGLKARFYELSNDELVAIFTPAEEHQSYPGLLHGGISSSILDETIGRAYIGRGGDEAWGMTMELTIRYLKPVPLGRQLKVVGRITEEDDRFFKGTGEIILPDGSVAVTGAGTYRKLSLDKISSSGVDFEALGWRVVHDESDPESIDLPLDCGVETE